LWNSSSISFRLSSLYVSCLILLSTYIWVLQVHGTPESATDDDDYSNGKLQFYAQDTAASVLQSDATSFLNLSVNPNNLSLTKRSGRT